MARLVQIAMRGTLLLAIAAVALALHVQQALPVGAAVRGVGFVTFSVRDPVSGMPMPAVAFYPTQVTSGSTTVGPYRIAATLGPTPASGRFPLIVFSHGTGGSRYDDHDFETSLARRGFVVAAVDHAGDNFHDRSGLGTDRVLVGRELQMSALIDAVVASRRLQSHVNVRQIGAAGFSAGGYDVLLMAGAKPDFALKNDYCHAHPQDPTFCNGWHVAITRQGLRAKRDPRVKAVFAMAPVGIYFNRAGLAGVDVPVDLWAAGADRVLPLNWNAARVRTLLPHAPRYTVIPNAGHLVFISPCTPAFIKRAPELCIDPPGVNRAAIHARISADAAHFFTASFRR